MTVANSLTQERLKELLSYHPETGAFTWRVPQGRWGHMPAGRRAGWRQGKHGYWYVVLDGTRYLMHQLAWLYTYGVWGIPEIDHRDGDGSNNRILNLRVATRAQNTENTGIRSDNTSGVKGVRFHKRSGLWNARVQHGGVCHSLGYFKTIEEAKKARMAGAERLHGEFFSGERGCR